MRKSDYFTRDPSVTLLLREDAVAEESIERPGIARVVLKRRTTGAHRSRRDHGFASQSEYCFELVPFATCDQYAVLPVHVEELELRPDRLEFGCRDIEAYEFRQQP